MRDRRAFLKTSLTAAALGASGLPVSGVLRGAHAAEGPLVIGAPLPISGAFAANGKYASLGAAFAAQEAGKVLGRTVTVADIDTETGEEEMRVPLNSQPRGIAAMERTYGVAAGSAAGSAAAGAAAPSAASVLAAPSSETPAGSALTRW